MTLLRRRTGARERLDQPGRDPALLEQSLAQVAAVNRWLGGRRALLDAFERVLPELTRPASDADHAAEPLRLLDVGCGSADLPRAIVERARRAGRSVALEAVDSNPAMVRVAHRLCAAYPEISLRRADARDLPYEDDRFDAVTTSMTLHHLEDEDARAALRQMARVARRAVIVNDLERSGWGYLGARALALTVWRGNRITRHDGPLSVLRAYTPDELAGLLRDGGLHDVTVERRWAFRLVATGRP